MVRSGPGNKENCRPMDRAQVVGPPKIPQIAVLFIGIGEIDYVTSNTKIEITTTIRITTIMELAPEISDIECRPLKPRLIRKILIAR